MTCTIHCDIHFIGTQHLNNTPTDYGVRVLLKCCTHDTIFRNNIIDHTIIMTISKEEGSISLFPGEEIE